MFLNWCLVNTFRADIESANNAYPAEGPKRLFNPQQQMPMTWPQAAGSGN